MPRRDWMHCSSCSARRRRLSSWAATLVPLDAAPGDSPAASYQETGSPGDPASPQEDEGKVRPTGRSHRPGLLLADPARLENLDPGEDAEHDVDRDGCPCGPCGDRGPVRRLRQSRSHGRRLYRSRRTVLPVRRSSRAYGLMRAPDCDLVLSAVVLVLLGQRRGQCSTLFYLVLPLRRTLPNSTFAVSVAGPTRRGGGGPRGELGETTGFSNRLFPGIAE